MCNYYAQVILIRKLRPWYKPGQQGPSLLLSAFHRKEAFPQRRELCSPGNAQAGFGPPHTTSPGTFPSCPAGCLLQISLFGSL